MPWQQHLALVAGELVRDESGVWVPAYPEVMATVPRQSGKTLWELAEELHRATLWETYDGKPQAIAHTGQTGSAARAKFRKEHWPIIARSPLKPLVRKGRFSAEDSGIDFVNEAVLSIWATSKDAGHGSTIDMAVMDEIWADEDERREQAAVPAMATRKDRQKLIVSTAGTEASTFFLRKQAAGRAAVDAGRTEGIAYVEFSADPHDPAYDPENPDLWRQVMPALGHTITERVVQASLDEMREDNGDLSEFARAWLNVTQRKGLETVIEDAVWSAVVSRTAAPDDGIVFAVDAQPDGATASIAAAGRNMHTELVANADGTSWLLDKLENLATRYRAKVIVDTGGPVGFLANHLETRGVEVIRFGATDVFNAPAAFVNELHTQPTRLRVRQHPALDEAVKGASKHRSGDRWKWSRKAVDVDISPLVAVTFAVAHQLADDDAGFTFVDLEDL